MSCGDTTAPVETVDTFVLEYTPRSADDKSDTEDIGSSAKPGRILLRSEGKLGEGSSSGCVVEGELVSSIVVLAIEVGRGCLKRAKKPPRSSMTAFC